MTDSQFVRITTNKIECDMADGESVAAVLSRFSADMIDSKTESGVACGLFLKNLASGVGAAIADMQRQGHEHPAEWMLAGNQAFAITMAFMLAGLSKACHRPAATVKESALTLVSEFTAAFLKMVGTNTGAFDFESLMESMGKEPVARSNETLH